MERRSHAQTTRLAGVLGGLAALALAGLPALFAGPALLAAPALAATNARLHPATPAADAEAARIARYWTPQRMRSTRPLTGPRAGNPLATPSFAPVSTPTEPPFAVNGRLFVRQGDQRGFCSATAIDSPSRRLVLTAAHCLNSGPRGRRGRSTWSRFVQFVPAYTGGAAPYGAFPARRNSVFVLRQWMRFGNPNFDVGAVLTAPNGQGVAVADAVGGGAALLIDQTRRQQFQTFGYPGRSTRMQACDSPYVGDDSLTYRIPGPPTLAIRCHWTRGASGGGWLVAEGTAINGLTSYGKRTDRSHTFGPYFSRRNVGRLVAGM